MTAAIPIAKVALTLPALVRLMCAAGGTVLPGVTVLPPCTAHPQPDGSLVIYAPGAEVRVAPDEWSYGDEEESPLQALLPPAPGEPEAV